MLNINKFLKNLNSSRYYKKKIILPNNKKKHKDCKQNKK